MKFYEAFVILENVGYAKVQREGWHSIIISSIVDGKKRLTLGLTSDEYLPTSDDLFADDWQVVVD